MLSLILLSLDHRTAVSIAYTNQHELRHYDSTSLVQADWLRDLAVWGQELREIARLLTLIPHLPLARRRGELGLTVAGRAWTRAVWQFSTV